MGKGGSGNPTFDVIPPAFEQLRRKRNRRKPVPYELIPLAGAYAVRRLVVSEIVEDSCEWREEQLRAVCLVSKKHLPMSAMKL